MTTRLEEDLQLSSQRVAYWEEKQAEVERELSEARARLERERTRRPGPSASEGPAYAPDERTQRLVSQGRRNAFKPGWSRRRKLGIAAGIGLALAVMARLVLFPGGASWPASVIRVQKQAAQACQNPDVRSEPGQVNFACDSATRQILWVFALLTSDNNPDFASAGTGRIGLEPITPAQGGEVAWTLNLHHPYRPSDPIDSLAVAARAINNIIGGATLTKADGAPKVEAGLESSPENCLRYTGSAAMTSRPGYPKLCATAVSTPEGQGALVADVYQRWMVGASPEAAQNAAVLFENATNPGNPQVQAILKHLPNSQSPSK